MNRKQKARAIELVFILTLVAWSALSVYTVFSSFNASAIRLNSLFYSLGRACGLIGFFLLASIIISGDVARYFDRFFGLDRIIAFHKRFSLIVAIFVIAHPIFFVLSMGSLNYFIPRTDAIPLSLGVLAFYSFLVVEAASRIAKRVPYMVWQYLHVLTYILFAFALYHALQIGSDTSGAPILVPMLLLLAIVIGGGIYRARYKFRQRGVKYLVKEVRWETKDTFTLVLKQSEKMTFKPGQFCFLRLNKPNLHSRHPLSISSAPNGIDLEFTIKLKGPFTKAASALKAGEEVKVEGPFGVFTLDDGQSEAVFIAFGVGITPFMSIILDASIAGAKRKISLFYASRSPEDIIFREKLASIKGDWLRQVLLVSSGATPENGCLSGKINAELLKKHVNDIKNSDFYLCGSEEVKAFMKKALKELGAEPHRIKSEEFFW